MCTYINTLPLRALSCTEFGAPRPWQLLPRPSPATQSEILVQKSFLRSAVSHYSAGLMENTSENFLWHWLQQVLPTNTFKSIDPILIISWSKLGNHDIGAALCGTSAPTIATALRRQLCFHFPSGGLLMTPPKKQERNTHFDFQVKSLKSFVWQTVQSFR